MKTINMTGGYELKRRIESFLLAVFMAAIPMIQQPCMISTIYASESLQDTECMEDPEEEPEMNPEMKPEMTPEEEYILQERTNAPEEVQSSPDQDVPAENTDGEPEIIYEETVSDEDAQEWKEEKEKDPFPICQAEPEETSDPVQSYEDADPAVIDPPTGSDGSNQEDEPSGMISGCEEERTGSDGYDWEDTKSTGFDDGFEKNGSNGNTNEYPENEPIAADAASREENPEKGQAEDTVDETEDLAETEEKLPKEAISEDPLECEWYTLDAGMQIEIIEDPAVQGRYTVIRNGKEMTVLCRKGFFLTGRGSKEIDIRADHELVLRISETSLEEGLLHLEGEGSVFLTVIGCNEWRNSCLELCGSLSLQMDFEEDAGWYLSNLIGSADTSLMIRNGDLVCETVDFEGTVNSEHLLPAQIQIPEETEELSEGLPEELPEETEELSEGLPEELPEETEVLTEELSEELPEETKELPDETEKASGNEQLFYAPAEGTDEYGAVPFEEEYSLGSLQSMWKLETECHGYSDLVNAWYTNNPQTVLSIHIASNTDKDSGIYKDVYNGATYGGEKYDIRIYTWGKDEYGQGYGISQNTHLALGSGGMAYEDGRTYRHSPTKIYLEYHFYKGGTLKSSSPQEVPFKGVIRYSDLDKNEGYAFLNGVNRIWTDKDSSLQKVWDETEQCYWYLGTTDSVTGTNYTHQDLWAQIDSTPENPYTCIYDAQSVYGSGTGVSTVHVDYSLVPGSDIPAEYNLPDSTDYTRFGTYRVQNAEKAAGYRFTGWSLKEDLSGDLYKENDRIVLENNTTFWGSYELLTGNLIVEKTLEIPPAGSWNPEAETSAASSAEGFVFHLSGNSDAKISVDLYAMTDSDGKAVFEEVPTGTFQIEETDPAAVEAAAFAGNASARLLSGKKLQSTEFYEITSPQTVSIKSGNDGEQLTSTVSFTNRMKYWVLHGKKVPGVRETDSGCMQLPENLSLEGAVYTLFDGENHPIAAYTTDKNGYFETDPHPFGHSWFLQETKAPEGFLINPAKYPVLCSDPSLSGQEKYTEEGFCIAAIDGTEGGEVCDRIKSAGLRIYKLSGDTKETDREWIEGAGFCILRLEDAESFLDADFSGSDEEIVQWMFDHVRSPETQGYEALKQAPAVCEELFSGRDGIIRTPQLYYGDYLLAETTVPAGKTAAAPRILHIREDEEDLLTDGDGKAPGYSDIALWDRDLTAYLRILKTSSGSGKLGLPGASFVIHDLENAYFNWYMKDRTSAEKEAYRNTFGSLVGDLSAGNLGSMEKPYRTGTQSGSEDGVFFASTLSELPCGNYAVEEVQAPSGFVKAGYEGTYRRDSEGNTFWEAEDPEDEKWARAQIVVPEERRAAWDPLWEEVKPVLIPVTVSRESSVYDPGISAFQVTVEAENKPVIGKLSVLIRGEKDGKNREGSAVFLDSGTDEEAPVVYGPVPGCELILKASEDIYFGGDQSEQALIYQAGDTVCTLTTDEEGAAWTETVLSRDGQVLDGIPAGTYELELLSTPENQPAGAQQKIPRKIVISDEGDEVPIIYRDELYILEPDRPALAVRKYSGEDHKPVSGALLSLLDQVGNTLIEWTSGENVSLIRGLKCSGTYTLHEVMPPEGFATAQDVIFTIPSAEEFSEEEKTFEVEMQDLPIRIDISVWEITPEGEAAVLPGAEYHLELEDGSMAVCKDEWMKYTSAKESVYREEVPAGSYIIRTDKVPDGFEIPDDLRISVEDTDQIQYFRIYVPQKAQKETESETIRETEQKTPETEEPRKKESEKRGGKDPEDPVSGNKSSGGNSSSRNSNTRIGGGEKTVPQTGDQSGKPLLVHLFALAAAAAVLLSFARSGRYFSGSKNRNKK